MSKHHKRHKINIKQKKNSAISSTSGKHTPQKHTTKMPKNTSETLETRLKNVFFFEETTPKNA